jgi:hypothetical protein
MQEELTVTWPLCFTVPGLPPSPNRCVDGWARRRAAKPFVDAVLEQARAFGLPQPLVRSHLVVTLVHLQRPLRDYDNAIASIKELVDALKGILIVDDSPDHMELELVQVLGRERVLTMEVWPMEMSSPWGRQPAQATGPRTPAGVYFPTVAAWSSWFRAADALTPGLPGQLLTVTCRGHHEGRAVFFQSHSGWLDARQIDRLLGLARPNRAKSRRRRPDLSQRRNESHTMPVRAQQDSCR